MRVTTRIIVPVWCLITVLMTAAVGGGEESAADFRANLETALGNVAALIVTWARTHEFG